MEKKWNKAAKTAGAAGLKIVNEIDDDDAPAGFLYSEREYI